MKRGLQSFKAMVILTFGFCAALTCLAGTPQKWADLPKAVQQTILANDEIVNRAILRFNTGFVDSFVADFFIFEINAHPRCPAIGEYRLLNCLGQIRPFLRSPCEAR